MNITASEMEAAVILVQARLWGLRAGGMAVSVINVIKPAGAEEDYDPAKDFDQSSENTLRLARMGSETIRVLAQSDERR
jgi:uridine phosphorylase